MLSSKAQALLQAAGAEPSSFVLVSLSKIETLLLASLGGKEKVETLLMLVSEMLVSIPRSRTADSILVGPNLKVGGVVCSGSAAASALY